MVPTFLAHVTPAGKLTFPLPVRGLMARYLGTLRDQPVVVTIKRYRAQRSHQANRYYFGVVVSLLAEYCGYEKDEMHELLAMRFLRIEDDPVTGSPRRKHTPDTNTKEFGEYVDACIRFGAELGVDIPAPGEAVA